MTGYRFTSITRAKRLQRKAYVRVRGVLIDGEQAGLAVGRAFVHPAGR